MKERKVFNIGFHKTGTTSLTHFMRELDFKPLHGVGYSMRKLGLGSQDDCETHSDLPVDLSSVIDENLLQNLVQQFDFFSDNPWPLLYKRLDRTFPNSLFILTRRKLDSWMNSLLKHTGDQSTRMRQMIYGYGNPHGNTSRYKEIYFSHNNAVEEYFYARKNFILIDIEEKNSVIAQKLASFLGVTAGDTVFPCIRHHGKAG